MFALKPYQEETLETLTLFYRQCLVSPVATAYQAMLAMQNRREFYQSPFGEVPCVCLRIPTGGGKTLLAAHSIAVAAENLNNNSAPVALWLTPSTTIKSQTIEALSNARHPYRQALAKKYGDRVRIADLDNLQTINPQDLGHFCVIVVANIQSFAISEDKKHLRNVYSFDEALETHFSGLDAKTCEGLEVVENSDLVMDGVAHSFLTSNDLGRIKYSIVNWFKKCHPIIIVDEAHNRKTEKTFNTLSLLSPSAIIEFTATPIAGNNVLYHVSAQELQAVEMIKLPVVMMEHPEGWKACIYDAVLNRNNLEMLAQKENDYIRPIALIQAQETRQDGSTEATVTVVKNHLIEELHIPEEQIAVATGVQRELDGINLFDPACPVRFVITVEALKEGWDCSFAYVLCSLQNIRSAKDVEQLLGRVLRMPYARKRQHPELNKAYAHVIAENFAEATSQLKDRMVQNMGFEKLETATFFTPLQPSLDGLTLAPAILPDAVVHINAKIATDHWPDAIKTLVRINPTSSGTTITIHGGVTHEQLAQVESFVQGATPEKKREEVIQQLNENRAIRQAIRVQAEQLSFDFAPIPMLCATFDNTMEIVERDTAINHEEWDLLDYPATLEGFDIKETVNTFEIFIENARVGYRFEESARLAFDNDQSPISETDLVRWLDQEVRKPYINQRQMQVFLLKVVQYLIHQKGMSLTALARSHFALANAIEKRMDAIRAEASKKAFQEILPLTFAAPENERQHYFFQYDKGKYPAKRVYQGSFTLDKHYYPLIHDLKEKTESGAQSEEFLCAQAIATHPKVKKWVRNIEKQPDCSFYLPTSGDNFYPDFVVLLDDGRVLVVEYKGAHIQDYDAEKKLVGEQWEKTGGGKYLFLWATKDNNGRNVGQQLNEKISQTK